MKIKTALCGIYVLPVALICDRVLKKWVQAKLDEPIVLIKNVLSLTYAENTGAAFSFFSSHTGLLSALTAILILAAVAFLFVNRTMPRFERTALWLIIAGGIGNLWDRIQFGYVIDMLQFNFIRFPIFNIADICVTLGGVALCGSYIVQDVSEHRNGS